VFIPVRVIIIPVWIIPVISIRVIGRIIKVERCVGISVGRRIIAVVIIVVVWIVISAPGEK